MSQAYEEFQREKRMVDGIIAKIMEEERVEQMDKMKKRNESVEMMRQVQRCCCCTCRAHRAVVGDCALLLKFRFCLA